MKPKNVLYFNFKKSHPINKNQLPISDEDDTTITYVRLCMMYYKSQNQTEHN